MCRPGCASMTMEVRTARLSPVIGRRAPGPDAIEHGKVTRSLIVCGNKARSRGVSFGDQGTKARITPTEKETS
jgi:hypothetical protein